MRRTTVTFRQSWREIGDKRIFARSAWEANIARYLEFLKAGGYIQEWEHEPDTFWFEKIKRGVRSYLPDFKITELDGSTCYWEVKGYLDPKSKTKLNRFKKYYPQHKIRLVDAAEYKKLAKQLSGLIQGWE
jgi:hypothetical protein